MLGYVSPIAFVLAKVFFSIFIGLILIDLLILNVPSKPIHAVRFVAEKLSNGDENEIRIFVENRYSFTTRFRIIDEIPEQFQKRNLNFYLSSKPSENQVVTYHLRPVKRGEYHFGYVNIFAASPIGFLARRFRFEQKKMVPVYPS